MKKTVFLDRDGVINYEKGEYTINVENFIINDNIPEAIKFLRDNDFLVIIITNQGGIAKKLYSDSDVLDMHIKLCEKLFEIGTNITDIFYCPHHPDYSNCLCRKPNSLLLEKAIAIYNVDVKKSFLIGDSERDIQAADKVGVRGIKIQSNQNIIDICRKIVENKYE